MMHRSTPIPYNDPQKNDRSVYFHGPAKFFMFKRSKIAPLSLQKRLKWLFLTGPETLQILGKL
jgi:hypothetical protein